jgi:hypothetical protein
VSDGGSTIICVHLFIELNRSTQDSASAAPPVSIIIAADDCP